MSIHFLCPLGHPLVVPDERAGKKGRCPICQQRVYVPELQSASPGNAPRVPNDDIEIQAVPAPVAARPEPMSELDRILAEELGLDVATGPSTREAPQVPTRPPRHEPPATPAPVSNTASPYAPAAADPALHAEVPAPGAMRPPKNLSSPGRPVRDPVPPQLAVPPVTAQPRGQETGPMRFKLAEPNLPAAPSAGVAQPSPGRPSDRLAETTPSAVPAASPPPPPTPQASWFDSVPAGQPHTLPTLPATPVPPQAALMAPISTPASDVLMPAATVAAAEPMAPAVRNFPVDEPLPWSVTPTASETHYALIVNEGWPQTTYLMVTAIVVAAGLGIIPLLSRWTWGVMPQWVTIVVGLTVIELAIALWLASLPDWSMFNLAGIATGLIAACYASGVAMVVTNASANALPLDLFDVRNYAGGWCTGNALCWGMISYALVRAARQWKRNLRRLLRQV